MRTKWAYRPSQKLNAKQHQDLLNVRITLEMAVARELLCTWHWKPDTPDRTMWLRDALGYQEKLYGQGAKERIRGYMRQIENENIAARGEA